MISHLLAQAQPGDNLIPLYYITAIVVSVGTAIWALARWFDRQRAKWANEATHDAHLADELRANTEAATRNTTAIDNLARGMEAFVAKTETRLNGHNNRIARLEDAMFPASAPYHYRSKRLEIDGGDLDDPGTRSGGDS